MGSRQNGFNPICGSRWKGDTGVTCHQEHNERMAPAAVPSPHFHEPYSLCLIMLDVKAGPF
jgi:hypothetical protein